MKPIRGRVYCPPDLLRYEVTDLIWLPYHDHLMAKFGWEYIPDHFGYATLAYHAWLGCSRHEYFGSTTSRENINLTTTLSLH